MSPAEEVLQGLFLDHTSEELKSMEEKALEM